MKGGGGDSPSHFPPPPAPSGGEFLLQLLRKQPQSQTQPPPHPLFDTASGASPAQFFTHDPAVAAVGPSLGYSQWSSNGHDLNPPSPWLHTLSPSPPHLLGFRENPPWSPAPGFQGDDARGGSQLRTPNGEEDNARNLGFSGVNARGTKSVQQSGKKLMFGSFPCEVRPQKGLSNGGSIAGAAREGSMSNFGSFDEFVNNAGSGSGDGRIRNRQYDHGQQVSNVGGSGFREHHDKYSTPPGAPPGFLERQGLQNRPREMRNWDSSSDHGGFTHNVDNRLSVSAESNYRGSASNQKLKKLGTSKPQHVKMHNESAKLALTEQIDRPGPPSGSSLHSAPALDAEESVMTLKGEHMKTGDRLLRGTQDNGRGNDDDDVSNEIDDLSEQLIDSLGLDDGLGLKNQTKRRPRDRDARSDNRGQRLLSQRMRNLKRQMDCRFDINRFNALFLSIYETLIPAEAEKAKQKQLLTLLEKLVCNEWPQARLYLYGSCANSFGVSKSDIDVCLAIEDANINKSEILLRLADILQSDNLKNVQALTHARVPIVKLMDPETGISCDICINNVLAVINTKLLRDYAQIDVRLRQLAFIVKHWAKSRGVNATYQGTLSSYAYVLMCIHFLQQRRPAILPCLQELKTTYYVTVDDVQCAFFDEVDKLREFGSANKECIAELVWAFFNYWAYCHDYTNEVISVRTGSTISKRAKDWTRRIGNDRHLICIEDPFEVSHDLGRVVDKFSIKVLREEFERAAYIMQCDPDPCITLFEPYIPA